MNTAGPTKKWSNPIIHAGDNIGVFIHLFIHVVSSYKIY